MKGIIKVIIRIAMGVIGFFGYAWLGVGKWYSFVFIVLNAIAVGWDIDKDSQKK
jgi:hypothetical protein